MVLASHQSLWTLPIGITLSYLKTLIQSKFFCMKLNFYINIMGTGQGETNVQWSIDGKSQYREKTETWKATHQKHHDSEGKSTKPGVLVFSQNILAKVKFLIFDYDMIHMKR